MAAESPSTPPNGRGFDQCQFVREFIENMPVTAELGIALAELTPGHAKVSLTVERRHTIDGSLVQAGITATLADFAAVAAAATGLPDGWLVATTGFSVSHLASAKGDRLIAEGRSVRSGKRNLVAAADVYVEGAGERHHCLTGIFAATGLPPPE